MSPDDVCVVGAGAVGSALALRLAESGYNVRVVVSRTLDSARSLSARIEGSIPCARIKDLSADCRLLLLCVPDQVLAAVASELAARRPSWEGCFVAHVSGAHSIDVLIEFSRRHAAVFGFHPIQTFPRRFEPASLEGCYVGVEGAGEAMEYARLLAQNLGMRPVTVASTDKALYHVAASIASNHLVALLLMVERLAAARAPESEWELSSFGPLIEQTLRNALLDGPQNALTGPIVRGDVTTVSRHLAALECQDAHTLSAYRALARVLVDIASNRNGLAPELRERLLGTLQDGGIPVASESDQARS